MSKAVIQANIQTANGAITVAPNASVAIRDADTAALVSLWTDRAGTIAADNPVTADASGFFRVYATVGRVNITATHGGSSQVWNDVVLNDEPTDKTSRQKNDFFNGQFRIAQAGTSFAAPVYGAYDLDGARMINNSAAVVTVAQVAGSSAGKLARQVTVTTADASIAASDRVEDLWAFEGFNAVKYIGNTFTIAFSAKFPVTGIHCVALRNIGVDRSYIAEIDCLVANTWADYSITVTGGLPTAGTWDYTNGVGLFVSLAHGVGSDNQTTAGAWQTGNYTATANQVNDCNTIGNVWAIENLRIALGTYCPPDDSSYDEDLAMCQRYYWTTDKTVANNINYSYYQGTGLYFTTYIPFPVVMRATPTMTVGGTWTVNNCSQPSLSGSTIYGTGIIALTTALGYSQFNNTDPATMYLSASARL